jgi:hypothetical protein
MADYFPDETLLCKLLLKMVYKCMPEGMKDLERVL